MLLKFEPLNRSSGPSLKASIDETPKLKLNALLSDLKYAFLCKDNTLPIILSAGLSNEYVREALTVFKKKKEIGWLMFDIIKNNTTFCIHKIYIKEVYK